MITFKCDLCKFEQSHKGIVRNHMAFLAGNGAPKTAIRFEQLIPALETENVTDVCIGCFKKITIRQAELHKNREKGIFAKVKKYIEGGFSD